MCSNGKSSIEKFSPVFDYKSLLKVVQSIFIMSKIIFYQKSLTYELWLMIVNCKVVYQGKCFVDSILLRLKFVLS